jgi:hypothetical protein
MLEHVQRLAAVVVAVVDVDRSDGLDGDWAAVLLTQRVLDASYHKREVDFTGIVRRAIQSCEIAPARE